MADAEQELVDRLKGAAASPASERRGKILEVFVGAVREALHLKPDEVAVLLLSADRTMLHFIYPPALAERGRNAFPLIVPSVAGQVVRTGRGLLTNEMRDTPRLAFYERVRSTESDPLEIRKLLAVPLRNAEGKAVGVVEASRRGATHAASGPNFLPEDQLLLERLVGTASPHLIEALA